MMSWGQLIWFFFPIPIISLVLLSIPGPQGLARFGTNLVRRLFFAKIAIGPHIHFRLLWFFTVTSMIVFMNACQKLSIGGVCTGPLCKMHSESIWYEKAIKLRAERNFWLALFNLFLWFLVWRVYTLKKCVLDLRDKVTLIEVQLKSTPVEAPKSENTTTKVDKELVAEKPKDPVTKKKD